MELIFYTVAYIYIVWMLYVLVMGLYRARLSGRLTGVNLVLAYPLYFVGKAVDIVSQYTIASLIFWELPRKGEWLVTDRLIRYMAGELTWRKKIAEYICNHILDPFDPSGDHC